MLLIPRISFNVGSVSVLVPSLAQIDGALSPLLSACSSVSSTPRNRSRSPINLTRQSFHQDLFVKNRIEFDIKRLVALRMLSPCEFHGVRTSSKSSTRDTEKSSDYKKNGEMDIVTFERDAPEIGIHAWQWLDARGIRRRGWAAISVKKKSDEVKGSRTAALPLSESGDISTKLNQKGGDVYTSSSPSPRNLLGPATQSSSDIPVSTSESDNMKFFKFSHPSIQSKSINQSISFINRSMLSSTSNNT